MTTHNRQKSRALKIKH